MIEKDFIVVCASMAGLLAGVLAELTVLAYYRRLDLWARYARYWAPGWMLTTAICHWYGWVGLISAVPTYALIVLVFWLDARRKSLRGGSFVLPNPMPERKASDHE